MLYDGITALDAIGLYEVFAIASSINKKFIAKIKGLINFNA